MIDHEPIRPRFAILDCLSPLSVRAGSGGAWTLRQSSGLYVFLFLKILLSQALREPKECNILLKMNNYDSG
jgi:hypothetical protein